MTKNRSRILDSLLLPHTARSATRDGKRAAASGLLHGGAARITITTPIPLPNSKTMLTSRRLWLCQPQISASVSSSSLFESMQLQREFFGRITFSFQQADEQIKILIVLSHCPEAARFRQFWNEAAKNHRVHLNNFLRFWRRLSFSSPQSRAFKKANTCRFG
ncbi:uncharacterized protein LOC122020132 isoform X3 [Zingiber officinale]|uniref:uncharacterized protein LOC122020132 isoform X3 n=1 Tax=Zingiber officinale TaxID=94328 RepID=UPI001C4BA023|nr:uncharacterized protein LOC122020132 isoform X3 [Zingiber officinale]